ncbi:hypothetical protein A2316_02085 [Candidatus Falkowbacteria bacterium RIFOXYB2_FULL_38_15]|uniref:SHS2 domain-containing protein n=1 Tax=Candidatus Falkowbacteria bacterium RIFOXYA2_FULL_38_12 TaxID=1797993 RepID=A0A1F5S3Z5_9BACT|nr:MAG: hypothetical protein A2257_00710 [Candidatus Falkowbacteria bacterium RIFOXYA2_FULL_38_12]OGF33284.1 MAG: hypothetical protein A2316_02085 [Candidatus Falkowbacteria bacterium RIFOXYB2_FULL_38_15]
MFKIFMPKSYLGVDLGTTSVKLVELKEEEKHAKLVTYGYSEQTEKTSSEKSLLETPDKAIDLLKKICVKAKTTTRQAVAGLPAASVFSSIITVPGTGKDVAQAVHLEAKKILPLPVEETILDWRVLGDEADKTKKSSQILLTAAPKELVKKYLDIFKGAGLNLISLETETFALVRSLVGIDKSAIVIINMGAMSTAISIIENGVPFLSRSLNIGGLTITNELSASLGMDFSEAEQLKYDVGMSTESGGNMSKIVEKAFAMLLNEIKYCVNVYQTQGNGGVKRVEKIILTGGGSTMPNFVDYLGQALNMRAHIGNPWARVIYPESLKPILDQIGPRFAVAIGLATREIE